MFNIKTKKTMKKTYINPDLKIVMINAHPMLAPASSESLGIGASGSANNAEARRGGFFYDDDEE